MAQQTIDPELKIFKVVTAKRISETRQHLEDDAKLENIVVCASSVSRFPQENGCFPLKSFEFVIGGILHG